MCAGPGVGPDTNDGERIVGDALRCVQCPTCQLRPQPKIDKQVSEITHTVRRIPNECFLALRGTAEANDGRAVG